MSDDLREIVRSLADKVTRLTVQVEMLIKFRETMLGLAWKVGLAAVGLIIYAVLKSVGVLL